MCRPLSSLRDHRASLARRRRRFRPCRLLRRGCAARAATRRSRSTCSIGSRLRGGSSVSVSHPTIRRSSPSRARSRRSRSGPGFGSSATSTSGGTSRTRSWPSSTTQSIYAYGAQADRRMGIPGEDLPGSWAATEFVAWYNGHPDFQDIPVRPLVEARGRDRERERRRRRRAHARSHLGGDLPHRHDRRGDRRDPRVGDRGDRRSRAPRARAGGVHDTRAAGADASSRARISSSIPPTSSSIR